MPVMIIILMRLPRYARNGGLLRSLRSLIGHSKIARHDNLLYEIAALPSAALNDT